MVSNIEKYKAVRSQFASDWRADKILEEIKKFNPQFYLIPVKSVDDSSGIRKMTEVKGDYGWLNYDEYKKAFELTCQWLHAKNPFSDSEEAPIQEVVDSIALI